MPQMPDGWGNAGGEDGTQPGNMPQLPDDWSNADGENTMFGGNRGERPGADGNTSGNSSTTDTSKEALYVTIGCVVLLLGSIFFVRKYRKF